MIGWCLHRGSLHRATMPSAGGQAAWPLNGTGLTGLRKRTGPAGRGCRLTVRRMRLGQGVGVGERPRLGAADGTEVHVGLQSAAFAAAIVVGGGGVAHALRLVLLVGPATVAS